MTSPGREIFQLSFQVSPIILTNGIASAIPGGMLPIIAITEALNFVLGLLDGGNTPSLDNFFASYHPSTGGTLIDNTIGTYPFANQAVAANSIIAQPLKISLEMICPVRTRLGYASKLATMIALQNALMNHNNSGGTYIVATPSFFYTNCVMTGMRDISGSNGNQAQTRWALEFTQPLLTLAQAEQAQNALMSKISAGTPFSSEPAWSGLSPTVGVPSSLATPSVVPAASNAAGAGSAPPLSW